LNFVRETLLLVLSEHRLLGSVLYGVQSSKLERLGVSIAVLALAGLVAVAPALRRVVRIEPAEALRHE
jgi:hypothetical protein